MKYFPLIWAALWRKPAESILTLLAVTVGFALFGLMVGMNATYRYIIDSVRMDRLYVNQRFSNTSGGLPIGLRQQLAKFDGVSGVGSFHGLNGYYRDPHNGIYVYSVDEGMRAGWSELPLSSAQWDQLFSTPPGVFISRKVAARLQLKAGDALPIITRAGAPGAGTRADGNVAWHFDVLGVVPDDPSWDNGFVIGNYRYIDSAQPLDKQGIVYGFRLAIMDPARAAAIARRIDRFFANSGTPTLTVPAQTAARNMANSSLDIASMSRIIAGAGLFMILFLTANGIAQSVRERVAEFGVLEAIGFRDVDVIGLVFAEAAIPCLLGALLGSALATVVFRWPIRYLPQTLTQLPVPTLSRLALTWSLCFAVLLALASAAFPVLRLRRLRVTDALAGR